MTCFIGLEYYQCEGNVQRYPYHDILHSVSEDKMLRALRGTGLRWNEHGTNGDLNDDDRLIKQMTSNISTNPALPILSSQSL